MIISDARIRTCSAVLQELHREPDLFWSKKCRPLRVALVPLAEQLVAKAASGRKLSHAKYLGGEKHRKEDRLSRKRKARYEKQMHDRELLAKTTLCKSRAEKMEVLEPAAKVLLAPDGTAEEYIVASKPDVSEYPSDDTAPSSECPMLHKPKRCYVCKNFFGSVHHFYYSMCPSCAALNYEKRFQTANLQGRRAIVTGARIKIGMHVALKLLRAGAEVIATTRYPKDAVVRFANIPDFHEWKNRLHVFSVDFRYLSRVERFADYVAEQFSHIDIIVHNAAQTIKRSEAYDRKHEQLLDISDLPQGVIFEKLLEKNMQMLTMDSPALASILGQGEESLNQMTVLKSPAALLDVNGLEVDTSKTNSWMLKLQQVETGELAEVFLINVLAPFVLTSRLQQSMERAPISPRFIINVSAMEGQFGRKFKQANHPHTNMAKAALNMMTRTSAQDLQRYDIFMNSVDTGWVNDEKPLHVARKVHEEQSFQTPLDEIDAAARILDPIFAGIQGLPDRPQFGKFFKDYQETSW